MTTKRQLRTRTSRPNYAALLHYNSDDDDAQEAGPSSAPLPGDDDEGSGSDFAPDEAADEAIAEGDDEDADADAIGDDDDIADDRLGSEHDGSVLGLSKPAARKSADPAKRTKAVSLAPVLSLSSSRQNNALPSVHHRHRAVPIYCKAGSSERLAKPPVPFQPESIASTHSWSITPAISERINKAHAYNVGPGPLWELLEDRAWYKEAIRGEDEEKERNRRPKVHQEISANACELLSIQDAAPYLPSEVINGVLKHPPPITCSFGAFGEQKRVEMHRLEARGIADFIPGSSSHVFNAGAPVWGLDWCPIHADDRAHYGYTQYLAVAPFPSHTHEPRIGVRAKRPVHACIQIWSLASAGDAMDVDGGGADQDWTALSRAQMRCEMVLCIDSGPAFELKWCPLPSNDPIPAAGLHDGSTPRKLGLLGGTFEDGSFSLYTIPDPTSISREPESTEPIYVRLPEPLIRIELQETPFWALDWANSETIALGCMNGTIAVYSVADTLRTSRGTRHDLLPTHYISVHQSAIRTLAWVRAPGVSATGEQTLEDDPTVIASGGYDGVECFTDVREGVRNIVNRTRDVINTLCYSTYCGSALTIDHENIIKAYSIAPSMLGRGHTLLEPDGPAWSLSASEYHPQLAIGVTDGSCLTTNTLRATRRGGAVPFLVHKIYQLDYSRNQGEYRMLEQFLPKEMKDRATATRNKIALPVGTGAWPREVGVQRVAWNEGNGPARAPLLASATGSGLCRVDWLAGRWMKGRIPYGDVAGIRREGAETLDEEDESD